MLKDGENMFHVPFRIVSSEVSPVILSVLTSHYILFLHFIIL